MPDTRSIDTHKVIAISFLLIVGRRRIELDALCGGRVPKDSAPLLDRFIIIPRIKSRVCAAMVNLHSWILASITRVHVLHNICPLLGGSNGLTLGAS